jgi:anti-sigma regulatory factor (Ser/Thr protein kinase)
MSPGAEPALAGPALGEGASLYERTLPAVIPSIGLIREELDAVLAAAGVALPGREDVALAVTEATTNVVVHAYRGEAPGPLEVVAARSGGALLVGVLDRGRGMAPRLDSPGCRLGLTLMSRLAEAVQIQGHRPGGGTCVTLAFAVGPVGGEGLRAA